MTINVTIAVSLQCLRSSVTLVYVQFRISIGNTCGLFSWPGYYITLAYACRVTM